MVTMKHFNDGGFSSKTISLTSYDSTLLKSVHSKNNKAMIEAGAAKLILRYFEGYVDARARSNPSQLHHVYEFDMAGSKEGRLFKGNVTSTGNGAIITFAFTPAKQPNRNGYPFPNKASVMESGETVVISPKKSKFLSYKLRDGRFIRTTNPSVVENPGGDVANNFSNEFASFQAIQAGRVLSEFKYFEKVNDNIRMKRANIIPKINAMPMSNYAGQAVSDATQIATVTARSYGE